VTIDEIVSTLTAKAEGIQVPGPDVSIQIHINGEGGGDLYVKITGGKSTVVPGVIQHPSVTATLDMADFMAVMVRKSDPVSLYFLGKIQVQGDIGLALKLKNLL